MPKTLRRPTFTALLLALILSPAVLAQSPSDSQPINIIVNTRDAGTPFPHFWEQTFGSGRAVLSLRESYRDDMRTVKTSIGFGALRFTGIFIADAGHSVPNST